MSGARPRGELELVADAPQRRGPEQHGPEQHGPERRCIVSGAVRPQAELIRFVVGPDQEVVPDLAGRLPGRGLWLTPRRDIVAAACARNRFSWAARRAVRAADDLDETVARLLAERCVEHLGLARRAGQVVIGFERVRAWLRECARENSARDNGARGTAGGVVMAASDGGEDGVGKLAALAEQAGVARIRTLNGAELGRGLGRERVVHAALMPGRLAAKITCEAGRLAGFRDGPAQGCER